MTPSTSLSRFLKPALALVGVVVVVALGVQGWRTLNHGTLSLVSAPLQTTAVIDGGQPQVFDHQLSVNLTGGTHTLTLQKPGYQTKTATVSVTPQGTTTYTAQLTLLPLADQLIQAGQAAEKDVFNGVNSGSVKVIQSQSLESGGWVVAVIGPLAGQPRVVVVARRQNDELRLAGGPAPVLNPTDTLGFPASVENYLLNTGLATK